MIEVLLRVFGQLKQSALENVKHIYPMIPIYCALGVAGHILYYYVWGYVLVQPYESIVWRSIAVIVTVPFIFINYWPLKAQRFLPVTWYIGLIYTLPCFFTYMMLRNDFAIEWAMSNIIALFLLMLLTYDWALVLLLFITGALLAWGAFLIATGFQEFPIIEYLKHLHFYIFILIVGNILNYRRSIINREKLDAMVALGSNIAHELRTPLFGIKAISRGLDKYLPVLIESYKKEPTKVNGVQLKHTRLDDLRAALTRIEKEVDYSNTIIDMLIINVGDSVVSPTDFACYSMQEVLVEAINRYPFTSIHEKLKVELETEDDFQFEGSKILVIHVIFNLVKNALYYIAAAGKGAIYIKIKLDHKQNYLYFKDTGTGIKSQFMPHIFNRFYSSGSTGKGSGIGLAFCQMVMENLDGTIECQSKYGEYTEFIMAFPKNK